MATLVSAPKTPGHSRAMEELDHLLQDLYVATNEENRLIEKEKQHIQALEAAFQERQKAVQNYQKITSQADKDIKFAHQQLKHNRANCESLKSHYGVLQQHLNNMCKKQENVNNKWKDTRADLSRRVDQYEGTWQTYQAKYEESELAMQLLDMESQVTLVNNRITKAQKTVEQLRNSISKLQHLDTDENQTFPSLNAFIIRIADVKYTTSKFMKQCDDKKLKIGKLQELGQDLQEQEKQLHQQLEEAEAAKQEQERLRKEKERLEAEKQRNEEQAARQREVTLHVNQGKSTHRINTPGANSNNNLILHSPIITGNGNTPASRPSHTICSNAAPLQQVQHKSPPFIQMPMLSSTSSSAAVAQQAKMTTSLGAEKGVKTLTAPPQFTLQVPMLSQQQQQQKLSPPKTNTASPPNLMAPLPVPLPPTSSHAKTVTVTAHHQVSEPQNGILQKSVTPSKPAEIAETTRQTPLPPPPPQGDARRTLSPVVSYAGAASVNQTPQTPSRQQQVAGNVSTTDMPTCENNQQQQQLEAINQPASYDLPMPDNDNDQGGLSLTPERGILSSHRAQFEMSKNQSPGFVLPSRPMFNQGNPPESEAMESTSSTNNFQDFSSIFSGNSFSQKSYANTPDISQMFATPTASNANDKRNAESSPTSFGGFMMPSSDNTRMAFKSPADMFGNPASPQPSTSSSSGGALSLFGNAGNDLSGPSSPAGFSFGFGGSSGLDSPSLSGSSSQQPFSLF